MQKNKISLFLLVSRIERISSKPEKKPLGNSSFRTAFIAHYRTFLKVTSAHTVLSTKGLSLVSSTPLLEIGGILDLFRSQIDLRASAP